MTKELQKWIYLFFRTRWASHKKSITLVPINDKQNTAISTDSLFKGTFFISHFVTKLLIAAKSKEWTLFVTDWANLASPQPKSAMINLPDLKWIKLLKIYWNLIFESCKITWQTLVLWFHRLGLMAIFLLDFGILRDKL